MKVERQPLSRLTTLGVGGECEVWTARNLEELLEATSAPYRILGGGSNLVVSDAGLEQRVIRLGGPYAAEDLERDPVLSSETLHITGWVGGGRPLPGLVRTAQKRGLSGLEGMVGIPAQVGGAVWMNAGTRYGEMFDSLYELEVVANGVARIYAPEELNYGYRSSGIPRNDIVTRVRLKLAPSTPAEVETRMVDSDTARKGQPKARTAGCAFKNPTVSGKKVSAGMLIDQAGLKGLRVGNAMIALEHGNFVVNLGGAKSEDIKELLRQVEARLEVALEWEYELWE
ncbi:MAG: UDP-N-acetylmuramate dehydrogenase [Pseudopedobacter sp.]|nr:UDP-N-acetylmuramate dehydrogenase [Deinococcales bacterium]